jgi:hypothetical protein
VIDACVATPHAVRHWTLGAALATALVVAACGGDDGGEGATDPAPADIVQAGEETPRDDPEGPASSDEGAAEPEDAGPVGAIVELRPEDLPEGFAEITFYNDIPGLLLESADGNLAGLGLRATVPGFSDGQGFGNQTTGELVFLITILLESAESAESAVDYIATRRLDEVFGLVEPIDVLFESQRRPDLVLGGGGIRYFLRYGVEDDGRRTRDVTTDLIVFTEAASLVFLQRSVNVTGTDLSTAEAESSVDLVALGMVLSERITEAIEAGGSPDH